MKKKINYPPPPALNAKEKLRLKHCLDMPGRTDFILSGSIRLQSFVVGLRPDGEESDLEAFGWINDNGKERQYIMPMLLVDSNCRVYQCHGLDEMVFLVELIRKHHHRWLYDNYREFWEKFMQDFGGPIYRDCRKEMKSKNDQ